MPVSYESFVRKDEFERRLSEVSDRITRGETSTDKRFDQFGSKFDQIQLTLTTMQSIIERNSTGRWQWIAGISVSFFIGGGGIYGALALTHALR